MTTTTKPKKWTKGTFPVLVYVDDERDKPESRTGYLSSCGLFGICKEWGGWRVSHIPTGCMLIDFDLLRDSKRFVELLTDGIDWNFSDSVMDTEQRHRYREAKNQTIREGLASK